MNVTVGITSYNQRDYLIEAIDSVLAQSAPPDGVVSSTMGGSSAVQ